MSRRPSLSRRGFLGLIRPRARASAPPRFSLTELYARREADGSAATPLPRFERPASIDALAIPTTRVGVPDLRRRKP